MSISHIGRLLFVCLVVHCLQNVLHKSMCDLLHNREPGRSGECYTIVLMS